MSAGKKAKCAVCGIICPSYSYPGRPELRLCRKHAEQIRKYGKPLDHNPRTVWDHHDYLYGGTVWTITVPDGTVVTKPQSDRMFQLTKNGQYKIQAATAETVGGAVKEKIVVFITVK